MLDNNWRPAKLSREQLKDSDQSEWNQIATGTHILKSYYAQWDFITITSKKSEISKQQEDTWP